MVVFDFTLLTSVRRRRRDLALLKSLGFSCGQLSAVVAWQSTVSVAIGVVIGVPLGIVFGRAMWDLFAHELSAIPDPTVPPGHWTRRAWRAAPGQPGRRHPGAAGRHHLDQPDSERGVTPTLVEAERAPQLLAVTVAP